MKFLITGVNGQLGHDVKEELMESGYSDILAPTSAEMDITKKEQVEEIVLDYQPDVIFHCAAYTAVDQAEDEKEKCYDINVNGTKYLTDAASLVQAKIIYISTDYVFDGTKDEGYDVDDETHPVNYYGETKYLGEEIVKKYQNHIIVRISWVFGINGKNFVKTMLRLAETKSELSVVSDQIGSPTYTKDLSKLLVDMSLSDIRGTYHATNEGYCSWYDFAKTIFEVNHIDMKVCPILTKDYKTKAKRPLNSRLNKDCLDVDNLYRLPDWKDAVERYCKVLKKEEKR
ncbi:MAG: dTDP-4-dehydrorhamnose reductase [Erysipelotrichaceae bacterium]|nr:dTDP-4-dehydrorhamnose reductase [Erysipelotrichaceae bacterium]